MSQRRCAKPKPAMMRLTEADRDYVTRCLAREPSGVVGVAARDQHYRPTVIINLPIVRATERWLPFPTLYWLVDPELRSRISDIERRGVIGELEAALKADEMLMKAHLQDNTMYAKSRWAVLNQEEEQAASEAGFVSVLRDSGIGGVADHTTLKCLHAQYAFHLAKREGTAIGKQLQQHYRL